MATIATDFKRQTTDQPGTEGLLLPIMKKRIFLNIRRLREFDQFFPLLSDFTFLRKYSR